MRAGVITIGSLFWSDHPSRTQWRSERLREAESFRVRVPIRYGRKSQSRANTYTMVFSRLCLWKSHGLGTAHIIRIAREITDADDLIDEAEYLWAAERKSQSREEAISSSWGRVALLANPVSDIPDQFFNRWAERISREPQYGSCRHTLREGNVVSDDGRLRIPWPQELANNQLPFDLLLSTATSPTLTGHPPTYPRIRHIARAWNQAPREYASYFWNNRKNGIHTYQDERIIEYLDGA
jgi:hypothetical protein